ncbi:MAG: type IV pilus biogenesis/stability protein PilW [Gammaproteobacteria bacterium]|nr:type IV pilus biogenesis/stability protein PilW [Gammaproteobacteria bacterium]
MKVKAKLLVAALLVVVLSACVSTTTTTRRNTNEPSTTEAAQRNYELGVRYYRNGSFELARERLIRALDFAPDMALVHMTLGLTYEALENERLATEHYKLGVRYEPDNFTVRNAFAVFLCRQREFDEALKQFDRAVGHRENDDPEIMLTNAGVCMAQKPDSELAESYLRRAIEARSSYGEALYQLARLKHSQGEDLVARAFLQRFLATNKANPEVLYLAITVEEKLGDNRASTDYANQLLREFPNSTEARRVVEQGLYSRSGE